jgi:hypothetical protein
MPFSQQAAERVRNTLRSRHGLTEKEMFGGVAFLLHGNMAVGVHGEDLIARVDPDETEALLREPGAKPFTLAGRGGMSGWLLVAPDGYQGDAGLRAWVERGVAYASSLPWKSPAKGKAKR